MFFVKYVNMVGMAENTGSGIIPDCSVCGTYGWEWGSSFILGDIILSGVWGGVCYTFGSK
jgi:hypothetical protein